MHENALRDPQIPLMQKYKFGVMCATMLFVESVPVPPERKKWCIDVSCPERTVMNYVTRKSHRMQKHKFGVTCPDTLFMETAVSPPEHEK
jgi:hypothetical protein